MRPSMMKLSATALALTFSITALVAQDPLAVLPDSYSKQFENEWVRVVRVRDAPYAKLPARIDEIHDLENTSELPSEFLRFDFKTTPTTSSIQR